MLLLILILGVTLPAASAFLLYKYTGDPTLRPFGLTKNSLAQGDGHQAMLEILVQVDVGSDSSALLTNSDIQQRLTDALDIYEVDFRLKIRRVPGNGINVTYIVKHNKFGPYRIVDASGGIPAALAALRAMQRP